jgi:hypothetical protein
MSDDEVSETVIVQVPRWSLGPWRFGPTIPVHMTVSYHPTYGFSTLIVEVNVPDRNQRFLSIITPIRHALVNRYKIRERITSKHRRQQETDRITAGMAAPAPPSDEPATHLQPAAAEAAKPTTAIFRMPKEDISTRITRLRDKRLSAIPPSSAPAWLNPLEMSNPFLAVDTDEATQNPDRNSTPTYTVAAEETPVAKTVSSVFRLGKMDISERLERCRKSDANIYPSSDMDGDRE